MEELFYEPELGINGTIPQMVDWANRYTDDYTDDALKRISELAKERGFDDKYIKIPLFLIDERKREQERKDLFLPYERMKIDYLLFNSIKASVSDGKGGESEVWTENRKVVISLSGTDEDGFWFASNIVSIDDFMNGNYDYLDRIIGETLAYGKQYDMGG